MPHALPPELQRIEDTVGCATLGTKVPRTASRTSDSNLDCGFVENALAFVVLKIGGGGGGPPRGNLIERVTRPG